MLAKITKPKRGRKPNAKKNQGEDIITTQDIDSEYENKNKVQSNTNALKFVQSNGLDQAVLESYYKIQTEDLEAGFLPTHIDDLSLHNAVENNLHDLFSTDFYDVMKRPKLQLSDSRAYDNSFKLDNDLEFQFNDSKSTILEPCHALNYPFDELNLRNGFVFNTGGLPLTMAWCPLKYGNLRYLFISIVDKNATISEFSDNKSLLTVLEVSSETGHLQINKQIILDYLAKEIEFSFVSASTSTLLKLTLSSGSVEVWKIDFEFFANPEIINTKPAIYTLESGNLTFTIPNNQLLITTSAFTSTKTFVFGTNHGYIGQFSIDSQKLDYLIFAGIPAITHIKTAFPTQPRDDFLTSFVEAADFSNYLIRLPIPNKKSCLINVLKTYDIPTNNKELQFDKNSVHLNNLNSFLNIEWPITIKKISLDNPNNVTKFKIANDDDINCLANQIYYEDGKVSDGFILLTGHTNGSIRLSNYLNLLTNTEKRVQVSTLKLLQLNKSVTTDTKYWLDLCSQIDKIGEMAAVKSNSKQSSIGRTKELRNVNPKELCPLKLSMLENTVASIWGNGLLIIEHLTL
ncbi:hypothetical protein PMKS-003622 [Pichia membranifaciens]|uniref:Uncharacterized protein n=1 Tax=Pichia membranifaciens TaxID=4926 RepID=A0A1Q2YKP3_9ASCO|nr:hypothetical protein PMKS-003622 [Pichia membranifaciens]